jgi:hypothetical protein
LSGYHGNATDDGTPTGQDRQHKIDQEKGVNRKAYKEDVKKMMVEMRAWQGMMDAEKEGN